MRMLVRTRAQEHVFDTIDTTNTCNQTANGIVLFLNQRVISCMLRWSGVFMALCKVLCSLRSLHTNKNSQNYIFLCFCMIA